MQFIRFCLVGGVVFIIDFALFNWLVQYIQNPYFARWVSFCVAIYCNWIGNTYFTFIAKNQAATDRLHKFCQFLIMSHSTGLFNLAVYSAAVYFGLSLKLSFTFGVTASLLLNFVFSKRIIAGRKL
ncbi:GtrA family protein [Pseudoalteromonas luteoviolacea]|uniref:Putative membrane protein n=1 Tax=Pseudoalteromonas luteoviolacea (strain 2ta16) TaxID=1353533 RepID=V4GZF3_PSEL2|nr:putative membrane protein [Pseudoalteromonas luteoviolacea 2ta16]KZN41874.1 hypothetical protein N483_14475 [Pseudoalteromonas luteoviolacea NCIMB 1944]